MPIIDVRPAVDHYCSRIPGSLGIPFMRSITGMLTQSHVVDTMLRHYSMRMTRAWALCSALELRMCTYGAITPSCRTSVYNLSASSALCL